MSSTSRATIIEEAAQQVINVRDFAVSKRRENEVAKETLEDNGIIADADTLTEVIEEANAIWSQYHLNS
jgi:hypothetical protein